MRLCFPSVPSSLQTAKRPKMAASDNSSRPAAMLPGQRGAPDGMNLSQTAEVTPQPRRQTLHKQRAMDRHISAIAGSPRRRGGCRTATQSFTAVCRGRCMTSGVSFRFIRFDVLAKRLGDSSSRAPLSWVQKRDSESPASSCLLPGGSHPQGKRKSRELRRSASARRLDNFSGHL